MEKHLSLAEQNYQVNVIPEVLATLEQVRAQLWFERSLNQLQSRLNDCVVPGFTSKKQSVVPIEAEIFQTVVNELNTVLNTSGVAIALIQSTETICKICHVAASPRKPSLTSHSTQRPLLGVISSRGKKLRLKLGQLIELEDLQYLQNQEPPNAWSLPDYQGGVVGWLIITTPLPPSDCETEEALRAMLRPQLMEKAAQQCAIAITQIRQLQTYHQKCQQLEATNQELARTSKLKSEFLANTSHEIRTPLSSILGFTHLLLAQGYNPSNLRHKEYLNIILSSGQHLLALINDILDLSKIEANQLQVQWETVNVPELCRSVLKLVKEKASDKGLELRLDLDPHATTLVADTLRLKQMLFNLLSNGLKFTTKGTVGLQVKHKGVFLHFSVWDTGTGISQEQQAELFQPYCQIANAVASRDEGTGLGLALTQKLAALHNGWIEVESELNHGSRFTIVLPLTPAVFPEEQQSSRENNSSIVPPSPSIPSPCQEILLVEDNLPNAKLIQTYLCKLGYQVNWVKNGAQMWEALKQPSPALILMDIHLPDVDGVTLMQQLRLHQQYQTIPVIAQTAMAMKGDRETCLAAGANDYISKPIDLEVLASLVSKYSQPPTPLSSS